MLDVVLVWAPVKPMCFWEPPEIRGGKCSRGKWPTLLDITTTPAGNFDEKLETFSPILQGFGPWNWMEILSCQPKTQEGSVLSAANQAVCSSFCTSQVSCNPSGRDCSEELSDSGWHYQQSTTLLLAHVNWAVGFCSTVGLGMPFSGLGVITDLLWMQTLANNLTSESIPSGGRGIEVLSIAFWRVLAKLYLGKDLSCPELESK